jgi:hypothetical protein
MTDRFRPAEIELEQRPELAASEIPTKIKKILKTI